MSVNMYKFEPSCYRHGALPVLAGTYCRLEKQYTPLLHSHKNWLEITYVCSGSGEQIIGERSWHVTTGDIMISNCGVVHGENPLSVSDFKTYCFNFTSVHLKNQLENCLLSAGDCPILSSGDKKPVLDQMAESIHTLFGIPGMEDACQLLAASFLAIVNQLNLARQKARNETTARSNLTVLRVEQYINRNYSGAVTLEDLSERFHISSYYLSHLFHQQVGCSLVQYLTQRRIGESQAQLQGTDAHVADIAERVGFSSTSYFNSVFRKYVGMTPREYRSVSREFVSSLK